MNAPPVQSSPRLFLIRHGETEWSVTGQHTGRSDIPLTVNGEMKATALGARLKSERFEKVFTSPLQRARRTCELAGFAARAEIDPDLVEWDYGDYEGLTTAQIHERQPGWNVFDDGAPRGERPRDVMDRAKRFIDKFREINGDVIAFSSGHFIRMLAACWLGLPLASGRHFAAATASVSILGYEHGRADRVIHLWNDAR